MVNKKTNGKNGLAVALAANGVSVGTCMLGLVLVSFMVLNQTIGDTGTNAAIIGVVLCATFLGARVLSILNEKTIVFSAIAGVNTLILMVIGGFLMEGNFQGIARNLIAVVVGVVLSLALRRKEGMKKKYKKIGYR